MNTFANRMENPKTLPPFSLENTYATLPSRFFSYQIPESAPSPHLFLFNTVLADELGLRDAPETYTDFLCGNRLVTESAPIAQAYAGHQFGQFTLLGDGRALLLGEKVLSDGGRVDFQLKGSGQTPYSRRGDGKATLKAMLREYIMSEALFYLDVPTTRSLAVVVTGAPVFREKPEYGAVLTRIASSHLRVGTFEFARYFTDPKDLEALLIYTIKRHFPELAKKENPALELLNAVGEKQTTLVVEWERIGFIHGVMNTDNTSISGESIDFGPCAFMNAYDPNTVFSSIDTEGRYAFGKQADILMWNLSVFAGALLPLIHPNEKVALDLLRSALEKIHLRLLAKQQKMRANKIGIETASETSNRLYNRFVDLLLTNKWDYTNSFASLCYPAFYSEKITTHPSFVSWKAEWENALFTNNRTQEEAQEIMQANNPAVIPRNHLVENALQIASEGKGTAELMAILQAIKKPYQNPEALTAFHYPPENGDGDFKTFCGT